jgi:hypothetical protein
MSRESRGLFVTNLFLVGLASFFVVSLALEVLRSRSLPAAPTLHPGPVLDARLNDPPAARAEGLETFHVVVAKNLFTASRSEGAVATARAAVPLPPKPVLHGIILDGPWSLAYLEDPRTRRVIGYRVGDAVAGGRLFKIGDDAVSIRRPDGQVEVLLKDSTKPPPVPERLTAPPEQSGPAAAAGLPAGIRR